MLCAFVGQEDELRYEATQIACGLVTSNVREHAASQQPTSRIDG